MLLVICFIYSSVYVNPNLPIYPFPTPDFSTTIDKEGPLKQLGKWQIVLCGCEYESTQQSTGIPMTILTLLQPQLPLKHQYICMYVHTYKLYTYAITLVAYAHHKSYSKTL